MSTKILRQIVGTIVPNHNVIQVENSLVYNNSNDGRVIATALDGSTPDRFVEVPGQPGFLRGLVHLDRYNFLVGSQAPAAVYKVSLEADRVISAFLLDGEPNESVYGICIIPDEFDDPPARLD